MAVAQIALSRFSGGIVDDLSSLSDEELLELSLKSPSMFEVLLTRYQREFTSRAQAVMGGKDAAEDVVQEAFVRIYRFAPRFRGEAGSFRAWSLTILMNVARTHYRKVARERGVTTVLDPEHYESLADPLSFREQEEKYSRELIERALNEAPPEVARIIRLAFLEELPYKNIAEQEQLSIAAVKTRVFRAKAVLKTIIGRYQ
jgi:RNA polymerase sigma-70 factor (ECF subfamily)